jgi:hypothetical protein
MKKIIILEGQIAEKGAEEVIKEDIEITILNDGENYWTLKFLIGDKAVFINKRDLNQTLEIFNKI